MHYRTQHHHHRRFRRARAVVARAFSAQGDNVARIDFAPSAPNSVAGGIDLAGVDLADAAAVDQAVAQVNGKQGGVGVLDNIAGGFT